METEIRSEKLFKEIYDSMDLANFILLTETHLKESNDLYSSEIKANQSGKRAKITIYNFDFVVLYISHLDDMLKRGWITEYNIHDNTLEMIGEITNDI